MMAQAEETIKQINAELDKIVNQAGKTRSFADTFKAYSHIENELIFTQANLGLYKTHSANVILRSQSKIIKKKLSDYSSELDMNVNLYKAMKQGLVDIKKTGEWDKLTAEEQFYANKTVNDFEADGL